jgi:predicted metal-dependent phosphoesterase TrpH
MSSKGNNMTWSKVDLHTHTNASDGSDDSRKVVKLAAQRGIEAIGIVDHDTTEGLNEAMEAGRYLGVLVVPGIELSTEEDGREIHLLGYFIDQHNDDLQRELARQRSARVHRTRTMVEELADLGFPISWHRLTQNAGQDVVGRPHIAQALREAGYVVSIREAFERLIGRGQPAYVSRPHKLTPIEGIELLRSAGGVPVLAHPLVLNRSTRREWSFPQLPRLGAYRRAGLMGLEAYYTGYSPSLSRCLTIVAERHGLIVTGGSDYHGSIKPDHPLGGIQVPLSCAIALVTEAQRERSIFSSFPVPMEECWMAQPA